MKLLIITQKMDKDDPILGFFHRWVIEFSKNCEKVIVICLEKGEYELPNNVEVHSLGKERKTKSYKLKALFRFYKYIYQQRKNYDAVFVHMNPEYVVLGGLFWRLWRKKIGLWYVHKSVDFKLRLAEKFTHLIFTASRESFRLPSKKVHVIGHGIDVERYKIQDTRYKEGERLNVLTVGRLAPSKGIETILHAISQLDISYQLTIVGAPTTRKEIKYEQKIRQLSENLGIAEKVIFKGAILPQEIPELLAGTDVFVSASTTGSIDKAVLEALAARVPVIAPAYAYEPLLGKSLVYPGGDSHALEEKLRAIHAMPPSERQNIGTRLYENVKANYSIQTLIPRILKTYE